MWHPFVRHQSAFHVCHQGGACVPPVAPLICFPGIRKAPRARRRPARFVGAGGKKRCAPPPQSKRSIAPRAWMLRPSPRNIPGWVATVITQAVLLSGCCDLHFSQRPGSAGPQWGSAHSLIFGSGGEMRLRVDPPSFLVREKREQGASLSPVTHDAFVRIKCHGSLPSRHTFSAFWLRSSVVSVLISLISDISSTAG